MRLSWPQQQTRDIDQAVLAMSVTQLGANFDAYFQLADGLNGWKMRGNQGFAVYGVFWAPSKNTL